MVKTCSTGRDTGIFKNYRVPSKLGDVGRRQQTRGSFEGAEAFVGYPTTRVPLSCASKGLDVRYMSMTAHMSSCGPEAQVRDAQLHEPGCPKMTVIWVSIYQ